MNTNTTNTNMDIKLDMFNGLLSKYQSQSKVQIESNPPKVPDIIGVDTNVDFENESERSTRTDPIRDINDIRKARDYFLSQPQTYRSQNNNVRNYMLLVIGIHCGRRISDMLKFKFGTFIKSDGTFKDFINIKESKTQKYSDNLYVHPEIKEAIKMYIDSNPNKEENLYTLNDYLFVSRKKNSDGSSKPISREQAWKIMKDMSIETGLSETMNVGTHTMRKTFGHQRLLANKNNSYALSGLQDLYHHVSERDSLTYMGFNDTDRQDLILSFNID